VLATAAALLPATIPAAADTPDHAAVYAWGGNNTGQLGDGTTTERHEPVATGLPAGVQVSKVATEAYGSMALTTDGEVYGWGTNQCWQLAVGDPTITGQDPILLDLNQPVGTRFTDIAAGYTGHRLALTSDGTVIAWGADSEGQAGNGTEHHYCLYDTVTSELPAGVRATAIAAGYDASYAVTSDNRLYAWGRNNQGQLGDGTGTDRHSPATVDLPTDAAVLQVVAGRQFAAALAADGTVYAWGSNHFGQLGSTNAPEDPHPTPVAVPLPSGVDVIQLSAGNYHLLALTTDGSVITWGNGEHTIAEVTMPADTVVRSVQAGKQGSNLILTTTGRVLAWGDNDFGRLGDGTTIDRPTPVAVHLPTGAPVVALATGWWHAMAVTSPLRDVTAASPFLADINWQLRYGITQGFGDGTFRPIASVTRGQMAVYLYRYAHGGDDAPTCAVEPFPDVAAGSPACGAIAWLQAEGLSSGDTDGYYHPGAAVSRQVMAAFLYRYHYRDSSPLCLRGWVFNGQWIPFGPPFPDIADDSPFWCAVSWLAGAQPVGITGGYPDGNFHPTTAVSRQTMAAFLHRYFVDFYGYGEA